MEKQVGGTRASSDTTPQSLARPGTTGPGGLAEHILAHLSDGVLLLSASGDLRAANTAARRILRLEAAAMLDANQIERRLGCSPIDMLRRAGHPLRQEIWLDGVPYQAELTPTRTPGSAGLGCVVSMRNFVEEHRRDQARSELLSVASHELRTPLTAVKNALDLLLGGRVSQRSERQSHFLKLARRNVHHLMEMINELLDSARFQSGEIRLDREPLDLKPLVRLVCDSISPQADAKNISLTTTIAENLPDVLGSASALERVLVNVVGNAIKFTPDNGTVRIEAKVLEPESGSESLPQVEIQVVDSGPGIAPDQLDKVFDRFHRARSLDQKGVEIEGTGLGLAIARELVEAHQGSIRVESRLGKGCRFILCVPVLGESQFLLHQLECDIERARRVPIELTLSLIRIDNAESLRAQLGEARYQEQLELFIQLANETTYRSSDRVLALKQRAEVVGILLDTPQAGGRVFAHRLIQALAAEPPLRQAEFSTSCAGFPQDAATAEQLYQFATDALEAVRE